MPAGAQGHGLGHLWQRLGPCAVLSGPVLAKSIFPVRGSLQAELGEQDRVPWCHPWTLSRQEGLEEVRAMVGPDSSVQSGRPENHPTCLCSVLQSAPAGGCA